QAPALDPRSHRSRKYSRGHKSPLVRVGRAWIAKRRWVGGAQGLEQVPFLPGSNIETGQPRVRFSRDAAAEMPFDTPAGTDAEHDGSQAVAIADQNAVVNEWRDAVAVPRRTDQVGRRSVRDGHVSRQRGLR